MESEHLDQHVECSDDEQDFWLLEESCNFSTSVSETVDHLDGLALAVEPALVLIDIGATLLGKHRLNPQLTSLVDAILKRKPSCNILDLGSGSPSVTGCIYAALQLPMDCEPPGMYSYGGGSYGSFRVMAHARDSGLKVSLTSVDVIFPPLSRPIQGESPAYFEGYPYSVISQCLQSTNVTCVGDNIDGFIQQSRIRSQKFDIVASRTVYSGGLALVDAHSLLDGDGIFIMDFSKVELQSNGRLMTKDQEILERHCMAGGFCDATILLSEKPTHSCGERLFFSSVVMFHQGALQLQAAQYQPEIRVERTTAYKIPERDALDLSHLFPGVKNFRNPMNENVLAFASDAALAVGAKKLLGLYFSSAQSGVSRRILPALSRAYAAIKCTVSDFEVVFISTDDTEKQMLDHYLQMPWLCPKWTDLCNIRQQLYITCDVKPYWDIPRLVMIDMQAGEILSNDAAAAMMDFENNHFSTADAATFGCTLTSQKQQRLDVLKTFDEFMSKSTTDATGTPALGGIFLPIVSTIYKTLSIAASQGKCSVALLFGVAPRATVILSAAVFLGCLQVLFFPLIKAAGTRAVPDALPENWQMEENDAFAAAMYLAVRADVNVSLLVLLGNDSILNARPMDVITGYTVFYAGPVD
jgi:hypothetical protein